MHKSLVAAGVFFAALVVYTNLYASLVDPAVDTLVWVALAGAAGLVMRMVSRETAHASVLLFLGLWLGFGVGLVTTAAFVFWVVSAWGLGWLALKWLGNTASSRSGFTEPLLLGTAFWVAIFGGLLYFPVNYRLVYLVICSLPCVALIGQASLLRKSLLLRFHEAHSWMQAIRLFRRWRMTTTPCTLGSGQSC